MCLEIFFFFHQSPFSFSFFTSDVLLQRQMSEAFVAISRAFPEAATAYLLCHSASQHTAFYRGGGLHGGPLMSISSLQKYFFFFSRDQNDLDVGKSSF